MKLFRNVLFWMHLCAGLTAGAVIAIMSFTGVVIAFTAQNLAWSDRDVATLVAPGTEAQRLPLAELERGARLAFPEARPTAIVVRRSPTAAVSFPLSRTTALYANPFTGEIASTAPRSLNRFLRTMEEWHRWLGRSGEQRAIGRAITGASNFVFLFLAISGVYLWWPRTWSARALRPSVWFIRNARGKARDWNWHNVIGAWCAPVLILLTFTGIVMSYRWANDLVFKVTQSTQQIASPLTVPAPTPDAVALTYEALFDAARARLPDSDSLSLRFPAPVTKQADGVRQAAVTVTGRTVDSWPTFATTQLVLDPFTGSILRFENYPGSSLGRKVRSWIRFTHTGEALGLPGQIVAAVTSLGGCFLVYTGMSLAWRRFFNRSTSAVRPD
jgi:uncharacterized iron-regulated membrane protein